MGKQRKAPDWKDSKNNIILRDSIREYIRKIIATDDRVEYIETSCENLIIYILFSLITERDIESEGRTIKHINKVKLNNGILTYDFKQFPPKPPKSRKSRDLAKSNISRKAERILLTDTN